MTQFPDLWNALAAEFHGADVKVLSKGGRQVPYITARTAMNRLDDVLGPENWWDDYTPLEHSVLCKLTVRLPDGSTLTKCDAGGMAGMADHGDDGKSGFSDALKRAAAKFGVGRYLYGDGVPRHEAPAAPTLGPDAPATAMDAERRERLKEAADVGKRWAIFATDQMATFRWSVDRRCQAEGLEPPEDRELCTIHQLVRHLLKWDGPDGECLFDAPEGIDQRAAWELAEEVWDSTSSEATRRAIRAEVRRYLGEQGKAALERALVLRGKGESYEEAVA